MGGGIVVFLGIVVAGNPEGGMVAGHGELCLFFLDHEIDQVLLFGKFVPEAQSVIKYPESKDDLSFCLGLGERKA